MEAIVAHPWFKLSTESSLSSNNSTTQGTATETWPHHVIYVFITTCSISLLTWILQYRWFNRNKFPRIHQFPMSAQKLHIKFRILGENYPLILAKTAWWISAHNYKTWHLTHMDKTNVNITSSFIFYKKSLVHWEEAERTRCQCFDSTQHFSS